MEGTSSEATLPKILLSYDEFQRLKYIEKKYLEIEKKSTKVSEKHSSENNLSENSDDEPNSSNQIGLGDKDNVYLERLSNLVAQKLQSNQGNYIKTMNLLSFKNESQI